jgi:hypothetical protein
VSKARTGDDRLYTASLEAAMTSGVVLDEREIASFHYRREREIASFQYSAVAVGIQSFTRSLPSWGLCHLQFRIESPVFLNTTNN